MTQERHGHGPRSHLHTAIMAHCFFFIKIILQYLSKFEIINECIVIELWIHFSYRHYHDTKATLPWYLLHRGVAHTNAMKGYDWCRILTWHRCISVAFVHTRLNTNLLLKQHNELHELHAHRWAKPRGSRGTQHVTCGFYKTSSTPRAKTIQSTWWMCVLTPRLATIIVNVCIFGSVRLIILFA